MSQVRTTEDLVSSVLRRCGEPTDGTSLFATQALDYLDQIHKTVMTGGSEFNLDVDEPWIWARAKRPLILELQPKFDTGTITLSNDSTLCSLSTPPAYSLAGWYIQVDGYREWYRVASHAASQIPLELDSPFQGDSSTTATFKVVKLDYDLVPDYIVIDNYNNKVQFQETDGTTLTATFATDGAILTPGDLADEVELAVNIAGGVPVYTCDYDSITRKYTLTSNRTGGKVFKIVGNGSLYYRSTHRDLGFDDEITADAASHISTYPLGRITKLTEPFRIQQGSNTVISGIDSIAFGREFPMRDIAEGCPDFFCTISEDNDGTMRVRFNKYPTLKTRIEIEHIPFPRALMTDATSVPLIPQKFIRVLEYGAAFYILTDKRDSKADRYFAIAQQTLQAMMKFNRKDLTRIGENFGSIIARPDLMPGLRTRTNNYGYDAG